MEFDKQAGLGHLPHPQHGLPAASRRLAEIRFAGSGLIAPYSKERREAARQYAREHNAADRLR